MSTPFRVLRDGVAPDQKPVEGLSVATETTGMGLSPRGQYPGKVRN